jgi:hypothetical protein
MAFIEAVNGNVRGVIAESVLIDKVIQGYPSGYSVIIDRISQDVPFYRAYLKNAAISGTAVINNPFWWSADEKFFNNALATKIGVPVPKTVILPPVTARSPTTAVFSNLAYPLTGVYFQYVPVSCLYEPFAGGWKNVYRIRNAEDFYQKHSEQAGLSCYCGKKLFLRNTTVIVVENTYGLCRPRNPHHLRYVAGPPSKKVHMMEQIVPGLTCFWVIHFNTVELAVKMVFMLLTSQSRLMQKEPVWAKTILTGWTQNNII